MGESSSGFSLVPILVAAFFIYNLFSDDDEDTKAVEVVEETSTIEEVKKEVSEAIEIIKPELEKAIEQAKEKFGSVKEELAKKDEEKVEEVEEEAANQNPPKIISPPKEDLPEEEKGVKL